jgi:hypothetical protein
MANTTAYAGKRMIPPKKFQRFFILTLIYKGNVTLNAHMGRAGSFARRCSALGNSKGTRNGLGILFKDGFPFGKIFVIFIRYVNRAHLCAFATASTFGHIHKAGLLVDLGN